MFKFLKEKIKSLLRKKEEEVSKEVEKLKEEGKKVEEEKGEKKEEKFSLFKFNIIKIDEKRFYEFFDELRIILWQNNVANEVVEYIEEELKKRIVGKEVKKDKVEEFIKEELKNVVREILINSINLLDFVKEKLKEKKPVIIVFFGINGTGKTTTIAKIAWLLKNSKISCIFAASDTFRAASIEQLETHAKKLNVKMIKHKYGSDPAAVAFDAINYAKAHGIDVVLIDTSGRMHTEKNLMEEMKKICKVAKPDLRIFVGEAIVGNDAIEQGKAFNEYVGIDGIILTKADIDEKGGAFLSIGYVTKKPILAYGTGQNYEDLKIFEKEEIVKKIFD
jgi:fused signal recognition particle receptor